jgi:hypothetical protein
MIKRKWMDENGQSALFDAMIFFIIMVVLASLMFFFTAMSSQSAEAYSRRQMTAYAEDAFFACMDATVPNAHYIDINGNPIDRSQGNAMIKYLLLEELELMDDGVPRSNFDGYESPIKSQMRSLVSAQYHYALSIIYINGTTGQSHLIFISDNAGNEDAIPRVETVAFAWTEPMLHPVKQGNAKIEFTIWRVD